MIRQRFAFLTLGALAALLLSLSALLVGSVAANKIELGPRAAWTQLNARASGQLDAAWDDTTGIPTFITGATPLTRLPYVVKPSERGNPEAIARGFLAENRALFKLGPNDSFTLRRVEPDAQLHYAHVRLDQTYHDIPVYGSQVVVHIDPRENITAVNGHFIPDLNVSTVPLLTPRAAENLALDDLLNEQLTSSERARVKTRILSDKTALNIYVDDDTHHSTLTWRVTIMTDYPLGQWAYFVNARRPTITFRYDTATNDKQRQTYSADNNTDIPGRLLISEGERSRDPVAQAAQDAAGRVYDYYFGTFKRDSIDGQGEPMVSTVHYGTDPEDAENAAWIGEYQQMIYGDGGRIFKPLSYGLDVVGHEFTHGITGATADLQYKGQSGALNESYSDVFGAMIDRGN